MSFIKLRDVIINTDYVTHIYLTARDELTVSTESGACFTSLIPPAYDDQIMQEIFHLLDRGLTVDISDILMKYEAEKE